jgi:WD40 repeat protein
VSITAEATSAEVTEAPAANRITVANAGQLAAVRSLELNEFILDIDAQPDGTLMGMGLQSRSVETTVLFDPTTGEEIRRFAGGGAYLAWSRDGAQLGTSTTAGQVTLWDAATFEPLRAFTPGGHFGNWSFDNSKFAFDAETGGAVKIWDATTDTEIENLSGLYPQAVVWSPTQDQLVIAGQGFYLWDAVSGLQLQENAINAPAGSADWSPDGKRIAIGLNNGFLVIWDMTIGARLFLLDAGDESVLGVKWSPDGTLIASTTYDGFVSIWDAQTGNLLKQFTGYELSWAVGWSSDMQWLATGSGSDTSVLTLWGVGP